jgi:hypothetical protein
MLLYWWRTRSVGDFHSMPGRLQCLDDVSILLDPYIQTELTIDPAETDE